jgi:polysaccharide pyruvyl transferase WcaK-like protein
MRIYVEHGEAYGNIGDEAMLYNALRRFNLYFGRCEFVIPFEKGKILPVLPNNCTIILIETPRTFILRFIPPFLRRFAFCWKYSVNLASFILKYKFLKYLFRDLHRWYETLKSCNIFYSVGAANLTDFCLGPCVIYKCWIYKIAGESVKVSVIGPQGIGPLSTDWARSLISDAFSRINFLAFRDYKESIELITALKPDNVDMKITGDEAFSLPVADDDRVDDYLSKVGISSDEKFVVIHFRETDYTKNTRYLAHKIANILDNLVDEFDFKFLFVPMSYLEHSRIDKDYGIEIAKLAKNNTNIKIGDLTKDATVIKGVVGRSLFSLGLSYHIHVFSLSLGKPAIILYTGEYYKYKAEGLTGFYNFPITSFNIDNFRYEDVASAIFEIISNYDIIVDDIISCNKRIEPVNDWCYEKIEDQIR